MVFIWTCASTSCSWSLSFDLFQSLPRSIGKLKRLSNFNCDRNQLTSLPKEVRLLHIIFHLISREQQLPGFLSQHKLRLEELPACVLNRLEDSGLFFCSSPPIVPFITRGRFSAHCVAVYSSQSILETPLVGRIECCLLLKRNLNGLLKSGVQWPSVLGPRKDRSVQEKVTSATHLAPTECICGPCVCVSLSPWNRGRFAMASHLNQSQRCS